MLALLNTLGFKYNNTAYRPVMDAMKLLKKYADVDGKTRFYDATDAVPMDGGVHKDWREAVVDAMSSASRTSCTSWSRCGTRSVCGHHLASYGSQRPVSCASEPSPLATGLGRPAGSCHRTLSSADHSGISMLSASARRSLRMALRSDRSWSS